MSAPEMPGKGGLDLVALQKLAEQALRGEGQAEPAKGTTVGDLLKEAIAPYLTRAAVVGSFLPRQLTEGGESGGGLLKEISAKILGLAERASGPDGARWALTPDSRRSVIHEATPEQIAEALDWTARTKPFSDEDLSTAIRAQIREPVPLQNITLPQLEAQRLAASWVGEKRHDDAPKPDALDQEVAIRRLMAPIYHMIGASPDGGAVDLAKIPFFGREDEIKTLNDYVGEVGSGLLDFISNVARRLRAKPPVVVFGGGGTGKTTLIARFVLEHAQKAQSRFPFVYLDFDRTAVSASRPMLLVAEMCSQVRAQFPEAASRLTEIETKARDLAARLESSPSLKETELETLVQTGPLLQEFRALIDDQMRRLESTFEFLRPFLLVLDTFEVVQYDDKSVQRIEKFVRKLAGERDKGISGWPRLRLIVSGRKDPGTFLEAPTRIELASLKEPEAAAMLRRLTEKAGRPLDGAMAERLVKKVRELDRANDSALSPLRIRLIGEIFEKECEKKADADSNEIAAQLIEELGDTRQAGRVRRKLIEGVLIRRILGHIADKRVKALADPGLVVRRISPHVIREVMAHETPKPGSEPEDLPIDDPRYDAENFERWDVSAAEAQSIFEAFKREARLVEQDGPDLRHRQDVREDMLPLIRASRPQRFKSLHRRAFEYFDRQVENHRRGQPMAGVPDGDVAARTRADRAARAEAIYHGLWLESVSVELLDRLWIEEPDFDPRLVEEEFEDLPVARSYVVARSGRRLDRDGLAALPPRLAVRWVVSRGERLLTDSDPNAVAELMRQATAPDFRGLDNHPATAAVVARLLYRTGDWHEAVQVVDRQLDDSNGLGMLWLLGRGGSAARMETEPGRLDAMVSLLRTHLTMTARLGIEDAPLQLAESLSASDAVQSPLARIEIAAYAALGARMRAPTAGGARSAGRAHQLALELPPSEWREHETILRLVILCVDHNIGWLIAEYLERRGLVEPDRAILAEAGYALAIALGKTGEPDLELKAIDAANAYSAEANGSHELALRQMWTEHAGRILSVVRENRDLQERMRRIILFDHHDWSRPLGEALTRALRDERVYRLFASRLRATGGTGVSRDGAAMVQFALARGALSTLVATILAVAGELKIETGSGELPRTVFDLAVALRGWHDANMRAIDSAPRSSAAARDVHDIFVSYSRADGEWARALADTLRKRGWRVFLDTQSIQPGVEWSEEIDAAIDAARVVIVLWSARSVRSPHVVSEAVRAAARGTIIPLSIDRTLPPAAFREFETLSMEDTGATALPSMLVRAIEARLTTQPAEPGAAEQRYREGLAHVAARSRREPDVPLLALQAQLARLGDVAQAAAVPARIENFVDEYLKLKQDLARATNPEAEVAAVQKSALDLLETGDLDGARKLFADALEPMRERHRRQARQAAELLAEIGRLEMIQARYPEAVAAHEEAAGLLYFDAAAVLKQLELMLRVLIRQGNEFGDNDALLRAIDVARTRALPLVSRASAPLDWARLQGWLGSALQTLGAREIGTDRLEQAVAAYRAALEERKREKVPDPWALTQNNLGNALLSVGERQSAPDRLAEAVVAYRAALEEWTREKAPQNWAMAQSNLGNALANLGERANGTARLEEAVAAFRAALEVYTRKGEPLDWAMSQNNLGNVLRGLGEREGGTARLEEAVAACRAALEEYTRDRVPLHWATAHDNLAAALTLLGERQGATALLEAALAAIRAALEERTRERVPLEWALSQHNLGYSLMRLAERTNDRGQLREAVAACRAALEERTRERLPLDWAATQSVLGQALLGLGQREGAPTRLAEAVAALRAALEERTPQHSPYRHAQTLQELAHAEAVLASHRR